MTLHDELRAEVARLQKAVDQSPRIDEDNERTDAHYDQGRSDKAAEVLLSLSASLANHPVPADEYHTMDELYEYRMAFHAHAARGWVLAGIPVVKSWKHSNGELCFGGGWFIVSAQWSAGQVTNHYRAEHWELFDVPEVDLPPEYDGHTPADALERLLTVPTPVVAAERVGITYAQNVHNGGYSNAAPAGWSDADWHAEASGDTGTSHTLPGRLYVVQCEWCPAAFAAKTKREAMDLFRAHEAERATAAGWPYTLVDGHKVAL